MQKGKIDNDVLFIDATNECIKVTNNNKLTSDNIDRIVDTFASRKVIPHFSYLASFDEISENKYNLSISSYVVAEERRKQVDIKKINANVSEIERKVDRLRSEVDSIIAELEGGAL